MDNMELARLPESGRLDMKKLGEMWKTLTDPQREEYQAKYEEQKRVYKDKVDEFLAGLGGQEEQDAYLNSLADYKAKRRAYLKHFRLKKLGLVKPRKLSAHNIFAGERLREAGVPGLNTELIKEIPSLWKALSDHEKQRYQKIAEERYATRLADYEERLAQEEGKVPTEEPKKAKKATTTKKKKKTTAAKKKGTKSATKKAASTKSKKSTTKKTRTTKEKPNLTTTKDAKSAKLDEDADQWISSDDED